MNSNGEGRTKGISGLERKVFRIGEKSRFDTHTGMLFMF